MPARPATFVTVSCVLCGKRLKARSRDDGFKVNHHRDPDGAICPGYKRLDHPQAPSPCIVLCEDGYRSKVMSRAAAEEHLEAIEEFGACRHGHEIIEVRG